ncbi:hypothetical protein [Brachybacterium massiliense]|uniref:hypothetical protein n=1 Tax=Brachybacterium massiliense TaxID=1755098 RepID=UPI000B3BAD75|nr:hypothetical protein [Brachybacterium massiliense]
MSIYAGPFWEVGGRGNPGSVRTRDSVKDYAAGRRGANRYPTDHTGSVAVIGLSVIPDHCVPGNDEGDEWGDRCRLTIDRWDPKWKQPMAVPDAGGSLILDIPAARALAAALAEWADGATASPKEPR